MARYRGILRAAVALVLLLPAARQADAQDLLTIDSGGARWKSGDSSKPSVTVDFGVIDSLSAERRRGAVRRQDRRPRRYLTLSIPQPETPPAVAERFDATAAPAAEPEPQPAAEHPEPAADPEPELAAGHPPPPTAPAPEEPAEAETPPARTTPSPPRRLPAGETEATPPLRAFLDRAAGNRPQAAPDPAKPVRAKLPPPPRPIQTRPAEPGAAAPSAATSETPGRFRLPPPAPATDAPGGAIASPAPAGALPPPPPATGTSATGVLKPPAGPGAGAPGTLRRELALDAPGLAAAPVAAGMQSESFFYDAAGTALDAEDRARLVGLAGKLVGRSGVGVEIRAYSGSVEGDGVEARRRALSRAMGVRRLLIDGGVPETRIVTRAAGAGEEARARVDVVLVARS